MRNNWNKIALVCFSILCNLNAFIGQKLNSSVDPDLSPQEWFDKGNEAYESGDYLLSIQFYNAILNSSMYSAEVFQNLGNAHYKLNHIPDAVYYFEKAIKNNPGNDDLIYNLELSNKRVVDKNDQKTSSSMLGWISSSIGKSPDYWGRLTIVVLSIGFIFLGVPLIIKHIKFRNLLRVTGFSFLAFSFVFLCLAYIQNNELNNHDYAINFSPSIEIKNEPSESSSSAFVLHEGSKIQILDQNKKWYKIEFNEKVGWIPKGIAKPI